MTSRRSFIQGASAVALGFLGLRTLVSGFLEETTPDSTTTGYGNLIPDSNGTLDLPKGFTYQVISKVGDLMDDGLRVPGLHDGMAAFRSHGGRTILIRNHELKDQKDIGPFGPGNGLLTRVDREKIYDDGYGTAPALGSTTTLLYNTTTQKLEKHFLSLVGTVRNCAGGPTPWNSWITCEEDIQRAEGPFAKSHGYNFEVPAAISSGLVTPMPLKAMGRFNHEAVAVDPRSGIVYETEDRNDGLLYRFIPDQPGRLAAGGRLEALTIRDMKSANTTNWDTQAIPIGKVLDVQWIEMENAESPIDDLRLRGFARGAARFARGEGMWYGGGSVYFACTNGGRERKGQIWRYTPSTFEGTAAEDQHPGKIELFIEPNDGSLIENADNLTVAPWGDIIVCEDGPEEQFLIGVTPEGKLYQLARNAMNQSEFAGAVFSPDCSTLFVNIQTPGATIAIRGSWRQGR